MIGAMRSDGARKPKLAIGHSAGGPGSVGAVYHFPEGSHPVTVEVFMAGSDEGIAEYEALRLANDNVRQ
jgi:D-alanyl-D-alanine carboxypeptidase